jgi:hypothetical protein
VGGKQLLGGVVLAMAVMVASAGAKLPADVPRSEDPPANAVALVSHVPVDVGTVTRHEFRHGLVLSAAAAGLGQVPAPGAVGHDKLKVQAMDELLDLIWIQGQAAEMEIVVTGREIADELASIKKQNFHQKGAWRRFLKESHFTRQDVHGRVQLQMLSARIQERIASRAHTNQGRQRAFKKFVIAYQRRWRSRTVCAQGYVVAERCSNAAATATG